MHRKIENALYYAGVDRTSFDRIKPRIRKTNLMMTTILSTFATFLISGMIIASYYFDGVRQNRIVYIIGLAMSVLVLFLSLAFAKKQDKLVPVLVYFSYSIYYFYGILIGAVTDPGGKTVTFMVMLVFMPILFIDRPLHIVAITSIFVTIFIILCFFNKAGSVLSVDVIDAIVFWMLGSASGCVVNHFRVRGYILEKKLHEISTIDQLTQMRNRNAFELEKDSIPDLCNHSLAVLYIDVNGLHELNNEKGHEFGDRMLKYVAYEIKCFFSEKYTYRVGGDEFVAFILDQTDDEIISSINDMILKIEIKNYHVAVGFKNSKIRHIILDNLINDAEKKMIENKKRYYKDAANREIRNHVNNM